MNTVEALLIEFLEELSSKELHEFQRILPNGEDVGSGDDALPLVKFMIAKFGADGAVRMTISTLTDIKQNQLASQLEAQTGNVGLNVNNAMECPTKNMLSTRVQTHNPQPNSSQIEEYNLSPPKECVIINNVKVNDDERQGSNIDADELKKVFNWLGFRVTTWVDLTAEEMRRKLRDVRDEVQGECFVCCVLSHGCREGILGVDGELVFVNDINSLFSGPNCPALLNKPKVFFFQACRGSRRDIPAQVAETPGLQVDYVDGVMVGGAISTPAHSDFLNCLSTVDDYVSIRCIKTGSWFIQSVCRQLREGCSKNVDILTILTQVNMEVSQKEGRLGRSTLKQTPEQRHTLRKKLYLRPPQSQ
ncbi:caspase-6-like [Alosa pseudoharengus]|uniref:caspase-6-like n=1 Tax=Alosa pseudoharengus TaxID=34774 RepID=UPI003F895504